MNKLTTNLVILFIILSSMAFGQIENQPDTIEFYISSVAVTAEKKEQNLMQVPVAISSIQAARIENSGITGLRDLTMRIPNLFMPDYGMKLSAPIFIRGIGSKINHPSIGLYIDNVAYFEKTAFSFELFDVERIEVLKGPQGTLYGRNTMGGIIHVISKKPTNRPSLYAVAEYGSFNKQNYKLTASLPLVDETLFLRLSGVYNSRDGYFTNEYTNKLVDNQQDWNGRMQLRFLPGLQWDIQLNTRLEQTRDGGYAYALVDDLEANPYRTNYDGQSAYTRNAVNTSLKISYELPGATLNLVGSHQYFDDEQLVDQDFSPSDLFKVANTQEQNLFTQEININSSKVGKLDWVAGLYSFYQDISNIVDVGYGADAVVAYKLPGQMHNVKYSDRINRGIAAFGQITFKDLLPNTEISTGIRADYEEGNIDYLYNTETETQIIPTDSLLANMDNLVWLPKAVFKYNLTDEVNTYVSYAKGYKSGGFNVTFDQPEEQEYEPEYSNNYEWGFKANLLDNKMRFTGALFYIDWIDQQIYQLRESKQGSMLKNAGHSVSKGGELEFSSLVGKSINLSMAYGYTHATFKDYTDVIKEIDYSGNFVPLVPEHNLNLSADYQIHFHHSIFRKLVLSAEYQYIGKHYWNDENTLSQSPYGLLNAQIRVNLPFADFSVWARNLTGTDYYVYGFESFGKSYAQTAPPMRYGVRLSVKINQ